MQRAPSPNADGGDNMVEILKFSRETAFTPETIEILAAALDEVWERMRQSGSRLTRPAYSRVMREVVAKRIMEMAQRARGRPRSPGGRRLAFYNRQLRTTKQAGKITPSPSCPDITSL